MNKISIIIPAYNYANYIGEAIKACLNQVSPPHEIIVVNDGSPDDTDKAVQPYLDKIIYIKQGNRGLPAARNTGIMNATGDFILLLDADDLISAFYLESIERTLESEPDADVVYCDLQHIGDRNDRVHLVAPLTKETFRAFNPLSYCSAIRRNALLECGGYNVKMVHGWEDYELWIELFLRGKKFVRIPEAHFYYRKHGNSMIDTSFKPEAVDYSEKLLHKLHPDLYVD